ncbi:hypothetical protein BC826DRAFT_254403 [Russula brevipes]|nr:hypothetical protein BC826DRAFT_254403 [Russula brevipes]
MSGASSWPLLYFQLQGVNKPTEAPFASLVTTQTRIKHLTHKQNKSIWSKNTSNPMDCLIQGGRVPFNLKSRLHRKSVCTLRTHPRLTQHIPHRQVVPRGRDTDLPSLRLARPRVDVRKPRSTDGDVPTCSGKCRYSCTIWSCTLYQKHACVETRHNPRTSVPATLPVLREGHLYARRCSHGRADADACGPGLSGLTR